MVDLAPHSTQEGLSDVKMAFQTPGKVHKLVLTTPKEGSSKASYCDSPTTLFPEQS